MRSIVSFTKKELTEHIREGKLLLLVIVFAAFGIMNPATAKLTPWLLDMMSESLSQSGISVGEVTVTAFDSWMQFYKNYPIALIAFILIEGGIFVKEYQSNTLVISLAKGFKRRNVVLSKSAVLLAMWTAFYWMAYYITYVYSDFYWDNSIASHLVYSAFCGWVFGVFCISLLVLFSCAFDAFSIVLGGCGGVVVVSSVLSSFEKLRFYLPTCLTDMTQLIYGNVDASKYTVALIITLLISFASFVAGIVFFEKKQI